MKKILTLLFVSMIVTTIMFFTGCDNGNYGPVKPTTETKLSQEEVAWSNAVYQVASKFVLLDSPTEQQKAKFIEKYITEEITSEKTFEELVSEYNSEVSKTKYYLQNNHVVSLKIDGIEGKEFVSIGMWSIYDGQMCIWDALGEYNLFTIVENSNNSGKKGFEREISQKTDCGVKIVNYYTFEMILSTAVI